MKTINEIFAKVVEQASEEMSNNGCNDFPVAVTDENRNAVRALCVEVAQDDEHLESLLRQIGEGKVWFEDWMVLDALVARLKAGNV